MWRDIIIGLSIFALVSLSSLFIDRLDRLKDRIAALEKWRLDVEETPKRQSMSELDLALINFVIHRAGIENRYFAFAEGRRPHISVEDQAESDELKRRLIVLAKKVITIGVTPELVLERLEKDKIEAPADLLSFIEQFRV
jgi:hypothetical protein